MPSQPGLTEHRDPRRTTISHLVGAYSHGCPLSGTLEQYGSGDPWKHAGLLSSPHLVYPEVLRGGGKIAGFERGKIWTFGQDRHLCCQIGRHHDALVTVRVILNHTAGLGFSSLASPKQQTEGRMDGRTDVVCPGEGHRHGYTREIYKEMWHWVSPQQVSQSGTTGH